MRAVPRATVQVLLLLDVDFWPSVELTELMQKPAKYQSLLQAVNNKNAIVLPAFETTDSGDVGVEVAREVVLGGCPSAPLQVLVACASGTNARGINARQSW